MTVDITLDALSITQEGMPLFEPINAHVDGGEFLTLMGPSGCGKSTLLSAIIGNLPAVFQLQGDVRIAGNSVLHQPIEKRGVGLLFQDDVLFPHLSIEENLLFGIPATHSRAEKIQCVNQALEQATLSGYNDRAVHSLSGGQASRISLLRTLLSQPRVMLMDEPFSKLDKALKVGFRRWVFDTLRAQNIPCILVTHDSDDALYGNILTLKNKIS